MDSIQIIILFKIKKESVENDFNEKKNGSVFVVTLSHQNTLEDYILHHAGPLGVTQSSNLQHFDVVLVPHPAEGHIGLAVAEEVLPKVDSCSLKGLSLRFIR